MADLTSVARVKDYAPLANTPNLNSKLVSLVSSQSETLLAYLDIACPHEVNANVPLDARGGARLTLPRQPVISVSAVAINGVPEPQANGPLGTGWLLDRSGGIVLTGGRRFPSLPLSVEATWDAGFAGVTRTTIPAPTGNETTVDVTPPAGNVAGGWAAEVSAVASADGATVFAAAANASNPGAGEYGLTDGVFTFNAANSNTPVVLSYYVVPGPLMQATNVMVSLALQQAVNIGVSYKNILGQGIRYETTQLNDDIKALVAAYKRMAPA